MNFSAFENVSMNAFNSVQPSNRQNKKYLPSLKALKLKNSKL